MWDGKERRSPLIDGAAYGTEMIERRVLPDRRRPPQKDNNLTGLCTVRDAVSLMFEKKADILEMYFSHEGKNWNVELRIFLVE